VLTVDNVGDEEYLPLFFRERLSVLGVYMVEDRKEYAHAHKHRYGETVVFLEAHNRDRGKQPHKHTVHRPVYAQRAPEFTGQILVFGGKHYVTDALGSVGYKGGQNTHIEKFGADSWLVVNQ